MLITAEPSSLIEQIAARNRDAFSQFYDRYSPLIYSLCLRMLRAQSDAEDLLQEVFMQVWRQAANYSADRGTPEAWLINMARSRAIDKLRSLRRIAKTANAKANNFSITRFPAAQLSARISQKNFDERPVESAPFFTRRDPHRKVSARARRAPPTQQSVFQSLRAIKILC